MQTSQTPAPQECQANKRKLDDIYSNDNVEQPAPKRQKTENIVIATIPQPNPTEVTSTNVLHQNIESQDQKRVTATTDVGCDDVTKFLNPEIFEADTSATCVSQTHQVAALPNYEQPSQSTGLVLTMEQLQEMINDMPWLLQEPHTPTEQGSLQPDCACSNHETVQDSPVQMQEDQLPSMESLFENLGGIPEQFNIVPPTPTVATPAPLSETDIWTCQICTASFKRSSLFKKDPSCPNCTVAAFESKITKSTVEVMHIQATCNGKNANHSCNQTWLARTSNNHRKCPVLGCNGILQYQCKICSKSFSYQQFIDASHACFGPFRRSKKWPGSILPSQLLVQFCDDFLFAKHVYLARLANCVHPICNSTQHTWQSKQI